MKKIIMPLVVGISLLLLLVSMPSYNEEFLLVSAAMVFVFMVNWVFYAMND